MNDKQLKSKSLDYSVVAKTLKKSKNILITSHTNPDGDAIGSSLALYSLFSKLGYNVNVCIPNNIPEFLQWITNCEKILIYKKESVKAKKIVEEAEIIFCLDYNDLHRLENMSEPIINSKAIKILIDHHPKVENDIDYRFSTTETSSTAELIYEFIRGIGYENLIDKEIAECIYVGIITDTGSLSYLCNYQSTYLIIAKLIGLGIDGKRIHQLVYDTFSENRLRLLGYSLCEKLKVLKEFSTAYIYLSKSDLKKFKYQVGDTEGLVNYALSIKGIQFAALFTERENVVRISFRSKENFRVNEFASKHFEGGGHNNAAGANSYISLNETIEKFENLLIEYKSRLRYSE